MDATIRQELLALIADDDATRARLAADRSLFDGYHPEMEAVHRNNAARLRAIVAARGWPGRTVAGADGADAAWRILQHAIGEPDFVRSTLPLFAAAVAAGEARPDHLALLEDRIRALEARPQRYGTQLDWDDTGTWMVPIGEVEDPDSLDARRAAVGLPPMTWKRPPAADELPPRDPAARRRDMAAWARRVGWR